MAMAAVQTVSFLQQHSSSRPHPSPIGRGDSFSWQASCSTAEPPASYKFGFSRVRRQGSGGRSRPLKLTLWRAQGGGEDGTSTQEDTNSSVTSVAPSKAAKGFGAPLKSSSSASDKKKSSSPSAGIRRPAPSKPLIGASVVDEQTRQIETAVVASLAFLVALILVEGVILAASGFLPDEWDEFAVKVVYPAFSPSVGVFLAIAAGYGLWKYLAGGTPPSSK